MLCPYCDTRSAPGSAACTHCGAILQGAAAARHRVRHTHHARGSGLLIGWVILGFLLGGGLGRLVAPRFAPHLLIVVVLPGALLGALLAASVDGGKALYLSNLTRARHAALQLRVNNALAAADERYLTELKSPTAPLQTRLNLAAWQLLKDEVDKATQTLQTAQRLGASGVEFDNNAGVALARRGSLPQALELFQRAASHADSPAQPHANRAHVLVETLADPQAAEQALNAVRDALKRDPKNSIYYDRLGTSFARDGRLEEARAQFQQALTLSGNIRAGQADARNNLGVVRQAEGAPREAAREFAAALGHDPGHAHALANQGLQQFLGGEAEPGLAKLSSAAHLDPHSAGVRASLGFALCRTGAINDGIRAYREALTLDPHLFEPYANLGKAYVDSGLPDVAEHYLTRASQLQPRSWEVMQTTGVVKVGLGQLGAAVSCYEGALHLNPQHPPLLIGLAVVYALTGRGPEAVRRLEQAARLDKDDPAIHGHRAWLHLREDSATLAAGEIEIALKQDRKNAVLHNNFALAQIGLGAYETALESLRHALKLDPNLHPVHYHIGCAYALLKQPDPAIKAWEAASKYELTNPDCFANLGAACYRKGDYDAAVTHFRRVLQVRQDRPEDYSNLGLTYAKQGVALRKSADSVSKATQLIGLGAAEEKGKQALQKHKQAIEMFDQALNLDPRNVIVHSNRGLACFFARRAEDAMAEWANVTKLDPLYARKRGKAQQSEFDDSQVEFIPLDTPKRAIMLPLRTADYLPRFIWGYDVSEWEMILTDPALTPLPAQLHELRALERTQRALRL